MVDPIKNTPRQAIHHPNSSPKRGRESHRANEPQGSNSILPYLIITAGIGTLTALFFFSFAIESYQKFQAVYPNAQPPLAALSDLKIDTIEENLFAFINNSKKLWNHYDLLPQFFSHPATRAEDLFKSLFIAMGLPVVGSLIGNWLARKIQ